MLLMCTEAGMLLMYTEAGMLHTVDQRRVCYTLLLRGGYIPRVVFRRVYP